LTPTSSTTSPGAATTSDQNAGSALAAAHLAVSPVWLPPLCFRRSAWTGNGWILHASQDGGAGARQTRLTASPNSSMRASHQFFPLSERGDISPSTGSHEERLERLSATTALRLVGNPLRSRLTPGASTIARRLHSRFSPS
jgi:hypothetical protein